MGVELDRRPGASSLVQQAEVGRSATPGKRTLTEQLPMGSAGVSEAKAARSFERAFGADFSSVEVARDGRADAMGAQAFAQGERIHLAAGAPSTESPEGQALLGHELTHVVQQRQGRVSGPQGKGAPVVADPGLEAEADTVGAAVARGESAPGTMHGSVASSAPGALQGKAEGAPIQMFGALEHRTMGDQGAQQGPYRWNTAAEDAAGARGADQGFTLTHGDIVMLTGDLFDARETDAQGRPIPDNLFALARRPGRQGELVGTQDELMYALYKENPRDPRFKSACIDSEAKQPDGSPAPTVTFPLRPEDPSKPLSPPHFSEAVKQAVDMRYLNLAARNRDHFVAPDGAGSGGPASGNFGSAGGSYRSLHEGAIKAAFAAGRSGGAIDEAMAHEAAAQHYLTDSFSSGHLRSPTGSVKKHWDSVYPHFWENLKRFISHQMAAYMNAHETNAATLLGTVAAIEGDIITTLEEKVAAYPAMGFERLVALATHDFDNEQGLKVVNDLGERWTAYGDGQMQKSGKGESQKYAIEAVELGCTDIRDAHKLPAAVTDPCEALKVNADTGRKYRSEQKLPRIDLSRETSEQRGWDAKNIDDLWDNPIRTDNGATYGQKFETSASSGEIGEQIDGMAGMIDATEEVWKDTVSDYQVYLGTLHPKKAFQAAVANPIKSDTKATLKQIVDFNPSTDQSFFNGDDAVMEEIDRMEARDKKANADKKDGRTDRNSLKGLTLQQRADWIKNIMGGTFSVVFEDEEERIVQIFETCPTSDRRRLYQMIEGHEWTGDYQEGFFTSDDELYNSLSGKELRRVRELLNEGP